MRSVLVRRAAMVATIIVVGLIAPSLSVPASIGVSGQQMMSGASNVVTPLRSSLNQDGRWKLGGDGSCYFDPDDSGPDQCEANLGRWKLGGDGSCYWDPADEGPNQCSPATSDGLDATDAKPTTSAQLRTAEFYSRA
jgi:hypothetical protein